MRHPRLARYSRPFQAAVAKNEKVDPTTATFLGWFVYVFQVAKKEKVGTNNRPQPFHL
jgi:hypothetical protein